MAHALGDGKYHIVRSSVADAKSIKNAVELEGFRNSHIRDGIALVRPLGVLLLSHTYTSPPLIGAIFCAPRGAFVLARATKVD